MVPAGSAVVEGGEFQSVVRNLKLWSLMGIEGCKAKGYCFAAESGNHSGRHRLKWKKAKAVRCKIAMHWPPCSSHLL